jgi:hypothetical protein
MMMARRVDETVIGADKVGSAGETLPPQPT